MKRSISALLTVVTTLLASVALRAEDAIQRTTEFGIAVTQEQVFDVVHESSEFWPAVRQYIGGNRFKAADAKSRKEAAAFLKRIHDRLSQRLMGDDQVVALDTVDFLATRLRRTALLRQLRKIVGNDAQAVRLFVRWEEASRSARMKPTAEQAAAFDGVLAQLRAEMTDLELSAEKIDRASPVWDLLVQCTKRMDATAAGQVVLEFEKQAVAGDQAVAALLGAVTFAADWAQVVKAERAVLRRADFLKAWDYLAKLNPPRIAARVN